MMMMMMCQRVVGLDAHLVLERGRGLKQLASDVGEAPRQHPSAVEGVAREGRRRRQTVVMTAIATAMVPTVPLLLEPLEGR